MGAAGEYDLFHRRTTVGVIARLCREIQNPEFGFRVSERQMAHLLIVDDEQSVCWGLARLGKSMGHTVASAASAEEAIGMARRQTPDAVVLDVRLPGMDGLTALERFHADLGPVPVILITAYGELETAVEAVRRGAFDYLVKPFDLQVAERAIRRALEPPAIPAETSPPPGSVEQGIVGVSSAMQEVFKQVALVARSDACVYLRGESGTGKELIARAIHRYSRRGGAVRTDPRGLTLPVAGGERALRPRSRRVHRGRPGAPGAAGASGRRDGVPR